jgi:aquaglyceroporin related protein
MFSRLRDGYRISSHEVIQNERTSAGGAFLSEFTSTALLVFIVFAITGPRSNIPAAAIPAMLFVTVLAIASGFGMQTGFALNPARDLGPRILSAMVGYGGDVFTYRR